MAENSSLGKKLSLDLARTKLHFQQMGIHEQQLK
ncbi:hypothetical protein BVRB_5g099900 [Beta vulgaris subsp. vulgaris]|nr:hypothetical protein BVRB_5g099900 [Beta vulgaris subsp. vulgaris]